MARFSASRWFPILVLIAGLLVGYTTALSSGDAVWAKDAICPVAFGL